MKIVSKCRLFRIYFKISITYLQGFQLSISTCFTIQKICDNFPFKEYIGELYASLN